MMHKFLISRLTSSFTHHNSTHIHLCSVCPKNASFFFNAFTSASSSESESESQTDIHQKGHSFTVSYLINSCGLSPDLAFKLSKRVKLENPDKPNAVLHILKSYGFSKTHLSILIKRLPTVLSAKPEKTLLPKLKFFQSIGVSNIDLPIILIRNNAFLTWSLKKSIIPRYKIIRSLVSDDKEVVSTLKHSKWTFQCDEILNDSVANIEVLRQLGLPQGSISLLVTNFPGVVFMKHSRFVEAVKTVKEMGFDPMKAVFVLALQVLAKMDEAMWKSKLEVFERWGWSRDICLLAFKKFPQYILLSEKKITETLKFLVKDMGWPSEELATRSPWVLVRNLEKTIIPRCAVVKILKSRGLVKSDLFVSTFIVLTEKKFLERCVSISEKFASTIGCV